MKLGIVPARQGVVWVRMGMRTFFRQPLALTGLTVLYFVFLSLLSIVPVVGNVLVLVLTPSMTIGLMAASRVAWEGAFPMPSVLFSAFRTGRENTIAMLTLGAIYAATILILLGITAMADGGQFARVVLTGGASNLDQLLQEPDFQFALLIGAFFGLPLSIMFWHAPALVHWRGVRPLKSLFFSLVACLRNFGQ